MHAQFRHVVHALAARFPTAAEHLADAETDLLAFTAYPRGVWRRIWSNTPKNG